MAKNTSIFKNKRGSWPPKIRTFGHTDIKCYIGQG